MASNVPPGVSAAWSGGSAPWGKRYIQVSPAAQFGGADLTLAHTSRDRTESVTNVDSVPPHNAAAAAAAAAVIRSRHLQQAYLPPFPYLLNTHGELGAPNETNAQGSVAGNKHDQHGGAMRIMLLEAEIKSAKSHTVELQHHMAYLQTQLRGQAGDIASLYDKIKALESKLASRPLVAKEASGASSAASISILASTTPLSTPASAASFGPLFPDQNRPVSCDPAESVVLRKGGLQSLCPKSSSASMTLGDATEAGSGESNAAPHKSTTAGPRVVPLRNKTAHTSAAADGSPRAINDTRVAPSDDDSCTEPPSASPAPAQQAGNAKSSNKGGGDSDGGGVETEPDFDVDVSLTVATPKLPRNSLSDFWADTSLTVDDSSPSRTTRNHRLRGEL